MVTGITEVTQDPEKAGNALKVVSMRLRGMKGGLEELGEEVDSNVTNLSKMQGQVLNLTHGKVNIFDDTGEFKSTYEILQGIAGVWKELSTIEQADLLETISGKHRANDIAALISNWENVEKATKSATEATGSAAREHAKYVDSIQGKLNILKATFQAFSNTFMGTDLVKGVISGLTGLLDILEKIINTIGTAGTAGAIASLVLLFKGGGIGNFLTTFSFGLSRGVGALESFGYAARGAAKDLRSFMSTTTGKMFGAGLIAAGIMTAISLWQNYQEKLRKARQETIDTANAFDDSFDTFEQAYIKYADKAVLTVDEENELKSAIDGTIKALGDKSGALRDAAGAASEYVSNLDKIAQAELEQSRNLANSGKQAAKDQLQSNAWFTDSAGGVDTGSLLWQLTSLGLLSGDYGDISNADFELPHVDTKEWKAIEDIVTSDTYKKYFEKGTGWREGYNFRFQNSKDVGLDGYVEQLQLTQDIVDSLSEKASETGDDSYLDSDTYKEASESLEMMSSAINDYVQQTYMAEKAQYQFKNGIATTQEEFYAMRESILESAAESVAARNAIGQLMNEEYADTFDLSSIESQMDYIESVTKGVEGMTSKKANTFETLLDMRVRVNNGECTVGDYTDYIAQANKAINSIEDAETQEFLRVQLGLELDKDGNIEDEIKNLRDKLVRDLTDNGVSEEVASAFADGLSATELDAAVNLIASGEIDLQNFDADKAAKEIEEEAQRIQDMMFTVDLEFEIGNLEKLNEAVTQSLSGVGLSIDSNGANSIETIEGMFEGLDGYDPSKLFERTANGIRLNTDEFRKLNNEYQKVNLDGLNKKMSALGDEYLETREELSNLTYGTDEYYAKASELSDLEAQINATEQLAAQYEGLASAYNEWQMAEEAGNQRDMYENVLTGLETVENEISRGWYDDGTIEFIELLTGKDLSTASIKEVKKAWQGVGKTIKDTSYSVKDFFTVNEDGESTNDGVYNFLDAVGQLEEEAFGGKDIVKRDKNGNIISFDFKLAGGDDVIAEALGVSEELVQIMVRAADDAGFVVSMDGTYQQLDVLKEKAAEAAQQLKNTFKVTDHSFFKDSSEEGIVKDYNEAIKVWEKFAANKNADGTVNMSVEGAEEAFTLVSTLQSMVDQLNEPVYMELNTSQVEKDIQTPLSKLQEYERLTQTEHQLKLKGTDTSEIDTSQEEILDYFEGLEPEIKAQLGIKNLSRDELQAKIESGEIEVPATVDLQVEMNDTLKDMVNVALYNAGLIDNKELKTRVDVDLYAKEVDTSDVENKTEEAVEKAGGDDKTTETTTNVEVKAGEVDTSDVENKTKEVVENDAGETGTVEKSVDLEVKIDEYNELLQNLEDADKDIKIKVTVEGLDQVEKLNKNIDLATEIDGDIDNLSEFVEGAKALNELDDDISTSVTADIDGNVTDEFEYKIDNLKAFAESAKDLKNETIESKVVANVSGNVTDEFEYKIDNLKAFSDSVKDLKNETITNKVVANIDGNVVDEFEYKIDNLKMFADSIKNLKNETVESKVIADVSGNVVDEFEYKIDNLKMFADSAKDLKNETVESRIVANIDGNVTDEFEYKIDNLKVFADGAKELQGISDVEANVRVGLDANGIDDGIFGSSSALDNLKTFAEGAKALQGVPSSYVSVTANLDSSGIDDGFLSGENSVLDNLSSFAEGAKALQGVPSSNVSVTASLATSGIGDGLVGGNSVIDNLSSFAEGANAIKDVGTVNADVTATLATSGIGDGFLSGGNSVLDNLSSFAEGANAIKDVGEVDASVTASLSTSGIGDGFLSGDNSVIDNLSSFAEGANAIKDVGEVSASVTASLATSGIADGLLSGDNSVLDNLSSFAEGANAIKDVGEVSASVTATLASSGIGDGFLSGDNSVLDNLSSFAEGANLLKDVGTVEASVTAVLADSGIGDGALSGDNSALDNLDSFAEGANLLKGVGDVSTTVTANLDADFGDDIDKLKSFANNAEKLQNVTDAKVNITANLDGEINAEAAKNLPDFAEGAALLQGVKDVSANVTATFAQHGLSDGFLSGGNSAIDNLSSFAEGANAIKGVGTVDANVTATFAQHGISDGLFGGNSAIDNLSSFAEGANLLKGVGEVSATASATLDTSGISDGLFGGNSALDNLSSFAEGANLLKGVGDVSATVTAVLASSGIGDGMFGGNSAIDNLGSFAEGANLLKGVGDVSSTVTASLDADFGDNIDNLPAFTSAASTLQTVSSKEVSITANINGTATTDKISTLKDFNGIASALKSVGSVVVSVTANIATKAIEGAIELLGRVANSGLFKNYSSNVKVTASVDSTAVDSYMATEKNANGKVTWKNNTAAVDDFKNKIHEATGQVKWDDDTTNVKKSFTANGTVTWTSGNNVQVKVVKLATGTAYTEGSAFSSGTFGRAFAHGDWGIKGSGVALGGELGRRYCDHI